MKKMSTPIVFAMLFVSIVALNSEAATDLIINEISPVAPAGGSSWIEFYNPTPEEVILAGLVVGTAETEPFEVPESFPSLQPGGYLLLRFGPGPFGVQIEDGPPQLIVVTAPSRLAEVWLPSSGELMIGRPDPISTGAMEFVDYVAWGARGAEWSRIPARLSVWKEHSFVPLSEGFGIRDSEAELAPGGSIGVYPGSTTNTPEDWVIFDPGEASPGGENSVPWPKAFTLPSDASVGSQSFAVGWASRKGDEGYHFQLAADPGFHRIIVDERTVTPSIRIGEVLPNGHFYYRVRAVSKGHESTYSGAMSVWLFFSQCDWPLPPFPWGSNPVQQWLKNPDCQPPLDCKVLPTIEFRFQRKDTHLVCLACDLGPSFYAWDHPHPYSQRVCFSDPSSRPCFDITAAGNISKTCARKYFLAQFPGGGLTSYSVPTDCCHGNDYCVMASLSMMASSYRACLSQDRIAFAYKGNMPNHRGDLIHGYGDGPSCDTASNGGTCTNLMRWALGIPQADFILSPLAVPTDSSFTAVYLKGGSTAPIVGFNDVRAWIDAGRPIMSKLESLHTRVVAGYCEEDDGGTRWVYIFDPKTGPHAEKFDSWYPDTDGIWVGPAPTGDWEPKRVPHPVRWDEVGVWGDWDTDGLVDFDEARRFGLCPSRRNTTPGVADKNPLQLPSLIPSAADPCDLP